MSKTNTNGKAVITGAKGGLGKTLTTKLQEQGIHTIALGRENLDVTSPESVKSAFNKAGDIDLLICSAGLTIDQPLIKMTECEWAQVMEVNLKGTFLCAREAARGMAKRRNGHIIFISSFSALHPPVGQVNYSSSKAALLGMMKSMAKELGSRNVRVNAIIPGFMETKMTSNLTGNIKSNILAKHTLGRLNTPETVAEFIFCLHQKMPHTSGQVFNLDSRILT